MDTIINKRIRISSLTLILFGCLLQYAGAQNTDPLKILMITLEILIHT